jgi:sensor histidine kinase YesM
MIIQPLVENAVKHGICNLPDGGTIRVSAQRSGSVLRIRVDNPVDPDQPAARAAGSNTNNTGKGAGIGLANVRQRLAGAYGHEASIHWARQDDSFGVDIIMPAQSGEQQ